jgi:mono/diheme cytochrome c family protein
MKLMRKIKEKRNILRFMLIMLFFIGFALYSCEKYNYDPPEIDPELVVSYSDDIQSIFDNKCISCHGGGTSPNLTSPDSYNTLINGAYVSDTPEKSKLYTKLAGGHSTSLSDIELQMVYAWISQGAKNN